MTNPEGYLQRSVVNLSIKILRRRSVASRYRPDPPPVTEHPRDRRDVERGRADCRRGNALVVALRVLGRPQRRADRSSAGLAGWNREVHPAPGAAAPEGGTAAMTTQLRDPIDDHELDRRSARHVRRSDADARRGRSTWRPSTIRRSRPPGERCRARPIARRRYGRRGRTIAASLLVAAATVVSSDRGHAPRGRGACPRCRDHAARDAQPRPSGTT